MSTPVSTSISTPAPPPDRLFDAIQMEVFSNRLLAIAEDMGSILIRSSFSTNIKERRDCSTALFDAAGRLIAQADHIPIHLGAMIGAVEAILARYTLDDMKPGDAFICNDPYLAGGSHLPDISIITPVHHEGVVRFFCGNIAHHADVGGRTPGSTSGTSRSIFEEGIRLPVIRIAREGEIDRDLIELIAHNTRDPEERILDLKTQIGSNARGADMLLRLVKRMTWPVVERALDDILTYTQRRLRARIAELPDGEYRFERSLDDDGFEGPLVPIVCTARISGENLELDFEGSGPQARGAVNLPRQRPEGVGLLLREGRPRSGPDAQPGHHRSYQNHRARRHHRQSAAAGGRGGARRDIQPPMRRGVRRSLPGAATRGGHGVLQQFHLGHVGRRAGTRAGRRPTSTPRAWAAAPEPSPTATGRMRSMSTP